MVEQPALNREDARFDSFGSIPAMGTILSEGDIEVIIARERYNTRMSPRHMVKFRFHAAFTHMARALSPDPRYGKKQWAYYVGRRNSGTIKARLHHSNATINKLTPIGREE